MKSSHSVLSLLLTWMLFLTFSLKAQDDLRNQLFGEANQIMAQAKEKKADLYSPSSFERAMEYYNEATDYYARGRNLEDIREKLKNAEAYFAKALDACKIGEVTFSATMAARTDAQSAGAPTSSAALWKKAEEKFNRAARSLEYGNMNSAKSDGTEAEALYRAAELEAIKSNFLSPARELLKKADAIHVEDNAPKTLEKAKKLALQVEQLLTQKRYDTDEARQIAQEAKYEAAHAIYLHQLITKMKKEDKTLEDALLSAEPPFQRIAGTLGFQARFDSGFEGPVNNTLAAIKEKDARTTKDADAIMQAAEVIRQKEQEIDNLKQQVRSMEGRLGTLTETEKKLQEAGRDLERKLAIQRGQEETIRQVSNMFTSDEGQVLRDGNNIVIRLYGLSFPVGERTIEPEYYLLLTKVQEAIKRFPNCQIMIEGHTDSQGSDETNQMLSEKRAKTVAEYIMANMGVEIGVNHQGFGESRPVANNETAEGRAKNRRIDVVITPAWTREGR
ncbi:MAG: OmpA family protein [Ignavibacteriae bacterium]|nr:OmpA family protein [Ignavibacteriota bacterium]